MNTRVGFALGVLAAALILWLGWYLLGGRAQETDVPPALSGGTSEAVDGLGDLAVGESVNQGGYTIERLPDDPDVPVPDVSTVPPKPSSVSDAAYVQISKNFSETAIALEAGDNFNAWMNIAAYHGMLENYRGAEEVLQYLLVRYNPEWQVHANLGNLYAGPLLNLPSAAEQYRLAIGKFVKNASLYRALFEVEARQGNAAAATKALRDGIVQAPDAIDLYVLLARHLKSVSSGAEVRSAYDEAIEQAQAAGDTELAAALSKEREQL